MHEPLRARVAARQSARWSVRSTAAALTCFAESQLAGAGEPAAANDQQAGSVAPTETVIVLGSRASLATAQEVKRNTLPIVDSVVASDVIRLPDFSVTDALQRVTGVQIARERGDGTLVTVRGLTQLETTLNDREIFTAGSARSFEFADIPSEMISRIDVYKTPSPEQIEGGLGGIIDVRTRRPLDLPQHEVVMSARLVHGELVDESRPQFSGLASGRWSIGADHELGVLLNVSHQERAWREDQKGTGNPVARNDIIPGRTISVPNGTSETTSFGRRERTAATAVVQWRAGESWQLYAEGAYAEFETIQNSHQINIVPSPMFEPGSATVFPGSNDLQSITWIGAPISILSFARDTVDRTSQVAIGGHWRGAALSISADLSHTDSHNNLFFSGPFLAGMAAVFTHDVSGRIPSTSVSGTDLLDPANFRFTGLGYRTRPFDGDMTAGRIDGELELSGERIRSISAGVRYARRSATNAPGLIFADASVPNIPAAQMPQFIEPKPHADFFSTENAASIGRYVAGNLDPARDAIALRNAFGVTAPIPAAANPLGIWDIEESTAAAYLMAQIDLPQLGIDGSFGVRAVHTDESVSGARSVPDTGAVAPVGIEHSYTDYLPSLNLRWRIGDGLYLRAAAYQTLTRPSFDQLSPSLILNRNPIEPSLNQGGAGNPSLKPIRADNFDVAVEKYFSPAASLHLTAYTKRVDGFVTTVARPEVHDGVTYQVSRPRNTTAARIHGLEAGYHQFFEFLPGWLSGFGVQANYSYVYSKTPDRLLGNVPLQNLSRHSYNVIGMYEHGNWSVRLAYNWRDRFLSGISNFVGIGSLPVYTSAYGWLDGSASYRINDRISLSVEGQNLSRTLRDSYYGVETRPQSHWINDRQISITATARL